MHNWWLATLNHLGLITQDQAQHISDSIKTTIHKDRYSEAFDELSAILDKGQFEKIPLISKLEADIETLKLRVSELDGKDLTKTVAPKK